MPGPAHPYLPLLERPPPLAAVKVFSIVVNMTVDFKLIKQDQRGHGPDQLHRINNVVVLLLA